MWRGHSGTSAGTAASHRPPSRLFALYLLYEFTELEKSNLFLKNEGQNSCPTPPQPQLAEAELSCLVHTQDPPAMRRDVRDAGGTGASMLSRVHGDIVEGAEI